MSLSATTNLARLRDQLAQIRSLADAGDSRLFAMAECSGWCPAEHLDHLLKVSASIVNRVLQVDAPATGGISLAGRIILTVGRIPRGRARTPERVRGERVSSAELHASLTKLEGKLDLLSGEHLSDSRGAIVPHPRFGGLRPLQALRFAAIHNDHHLRIVDDILKETS